MYWYNPTTLASERVVAPSTDEEAVDMLTGHPDSAEFVREYGKLRHSAIPIEQALVLVGHEFRLRKPEYRLALRLRILLHRKRIASEFRRNSTFETV